MTTTDDAAVTDRDVYITRSFAAPRAVVWQFWTDPLRLTDWFGPPGVTVQPGSAVVDLRVGGRWSLTMVDDATGSAHPVLGRIRRLEVEEYLEIVMSAETTAGPAEDVLLRVRFHDHGDRTRITLHQGPFSDELRRITAAGWTAAFLALDGLIERSRNGSEDH